MSIQVYATLTVYNPSSILSYRFMPSSEKEKKKKIKVCSDKVSEQVREKTRGKRGCSMLAGWAG